MWAEGVPATVGEKSEELKICIEEVMRSGKWLRD
jgi:hypothetical protein